MTALTYALARALSRHCDDGATAAEYVILVSLVAGVIIAVVFVIGDRVAELFATLVGAF
jgi:Flp pilus assembly pilin Flp